LIELEAEVPRLGRLRKLTQVSRALTSATSLDQVLSLTVAEAAQLLDGRGAALLLYDEEGRLQVRATHAVSDSFVRNAPPTASLEQLLSAVLGESSPRGPVAVPLIVGGKVSGVLAVLRGDEDIPEDEEEWLLSALADQSMVALEKERLEQIRGRGERRALVARVGYRLLGQENVASLFDEISAAIASELGIERVGIFGRRPEGPFELLGGAGWAPPTQPPSVVMQPGSTSWEARALDGKAPIAFGATDLAEQRTSEGFLRDSRVKSGMAVVIEPAQRNRVIGMYTHVPREFSQEESDVLASLAALLSSALEREAADAERKIAAEMRDDLLAIVSHDLRNPLFAITAAASVLADVKAHTNATTLARCVGLIDRNARRMTSMIKDLLDFESLRGGGLSVDVGEHELGPVLAEIVDMIQPQAKTKSLQLTCSALAGVKGWFDRDRTLQVLSNLVGNAVKFTAEGGTIMVGADVLADEIRVFVRDTGAGIPAEDLAHVFDRYWQAKRSDRRGIGLGLPIAKGLVEAQGGKLWVESERGLGTTFYFTIVSGGAPALGATAGRGR
jgi:signal transduction histidine kinase